MVVSDEGSAGVDSEQFADKLLQLKRTGASVLIVGSVQPDQRIDISRRLLGKPIKRGRRYVFASTTADNHAIAPLLEHTEPAHREIVTYSAHARSVATMQEAIDVPSTQPAHAETLADLGIGVSRAIERFETEGDGLEPSALRVCVDSLLPLLEEYGRERVFRFMHLINGRTRETGGLVHYHLPVERELPVVSVLSAVADVVVELRDRNGFHQERWTLTRSNESSGWVSVPHA